MIELKYSDVRLCVSPDRAGGVLNFDWREIPIFTPHRPNDSSPLGLSCFPLVPFSNRIEKGRFIFEGKSYEIIPNFPLASTDHAIHGYGLTAAWEVEYRDSTQARMVFDYIAGDWPWNFRAKQEYRLTPDGFIHIIEISNTSDSAMPACLGYHPYFPRKSAKLIHDFDGFWDIDDRGLPTSWLPQTALLDLASEDTIDVDFTGRKQSLKVVWPSHQLEIAPSADLPLTHIYVPVGEEYFCLEPISHMTNAINHNGIKTLQPNECWSVKVSYTLSS